MKLGNRGTELDERKINNIALELKIKLPRDYVYFMMESNGGTPDDGANFDFEYLDYNTGAVEIQGSNVQLFYDMEQVLDSYCNLKEENIIEKGYLPIACDDFGNDILICCNEGLNFGKIYFANHEILRMDGQPSKMFLVSNSFKNFVESLYTDEELLKKQ